MSVSGFGSSLISAQVDAVIFDTYDTQLGVVRGLCFAGQAIGQSLFPHLLTGLIDTYAYSFSFMVYAGIILQTLPAIMLLKVDDKIRRPVSYSRYTDKTYAIFNNEAMNGYTTELQLHDLSKKCWQSPSDDNLHRHDEGGELDDDRYVNVTITPPPSPEEKRRNIFGVEILPEIPEESEGSDDECSDSVEDFGSNRKRFSFAIKRLSTMGDNFDDYITKQIRRDSGQTESDGCESKEYSEVEVTYDTISPVTEIQREKIFNSFSFRCQSAYASMRRRMRMPSYRVYRLQRRAVYIMYNINDTFIKPLTRSLSCWRFYPALMLCFCKLTLSAVSLVLLPMIATQVKPKISMTETNFLISLHGFTWICFLLCTPWLAQTPKRNYKYVTVIGLIISTGATFGTNYTLKLLSVKHFYYFLLTFSYFFTVLAEANNHDFFSIGCVVAGIGYGAITSCWETSVQDFVGTRKWPKLHSTLETLSSTLLTLFVVVLCFLIGDEGGLQRCMFIVGVVLAVITVIWSIIAIVAIYVTKVRSLKLGRSWVVN